MRSYRVWWVHRRFRKTLKSFYVWYIRNFLNTKAGEAWMKAHFHGEFVCMWPSCEHMANMSSFDSCQLCHTTCHLWSIQQQLQFPLTTPEQCADTNDLWSSPKGNYRRDSSPVNMVARTPHPKRSVNLFVNDMATKHFIRTSKTIFAVCGRAPTCWKSVVLSCPAFRMAGMVSICCFSALYALERIVRKNSRSFQNMIYTL
jgi:hypothetical protein